MQGTDGCEAGSETGCWAEGCEETHFEILCFGRFKVLDVLW